MWGFTILLLTIVEAYGDLFSKTFAWPGFGHTAVVGFIEDFFAVAVLLALMVFATIRIVNAPARRQRSSRFYGSHTGAAWLVLAMIAMVIITLLGYRAAQTNTGDFPYGWWAFASHGIGRALHPLGVSTNKVLETVFLLLNVAVISGFLVFISYSKHLHIFVAPINVAFSRRPRALGALDKTPDMDMENVTEDTVFGVGLIEQFTWKQLLDFATCTECGRCQSVCPAWNTDKPLSPKLVVMGLHDNMFASADRLLARTGSDQPNGNGAEQSAEIQTLVPFTIEPDVLWSCTTCGACVEQCPVDIEHVDAIVDMRRYEVLMESRFPSEAGLMLRNIENQGDPWGLGQAKRTEWTGVLDFDIPVVTDSIPDDVEYLYWVGSRALWMSVPARVCRRPRGCCTGRVSDSPFLGRRSRAPATQPGASATSTSSKSKAARTWPSSMAWVPARSSPAVPIASTPSRTSTRRSGATTKSSIMRNSLSTWCSRDAWYPAAAIRAKLPTTTPATSVGTIGSLTSLVR